MAEEVNAILIVEKGGEAGTTFQVKPDRVILGRGQTEANKIAFDNPVVSRTHAEIHYQDGSFWLRDLGSTNGTRVNGKPLEKMVDHPLSSNDAIELAKGSVVLRFRQSQRTVEIGIDELAAPPMPPIWVDERAREVWVDGAKIEPPLSFRDFELLLLLYCSLEKACSKDEMATAWGEEFVTDEQIEQSIYRIRQRVEPDPRNPSRIITIRGFGYKLTLPTQA